LGSFWPPWAQVAVFAYGEVKRVKALDDTKFEVAIEYINMGDSVRNEIIQAIGDYKTFGLRYDLDTQAWAIITNANLNQANTFSLDNAGSSSSTSADNSWYSFCVAGYIRRADLGHI